MQSQHGTLRYWEQCRNFFTTRPGWIPLVSFAAAFAILWLLREVQRRFWYSYSNLPGPKAKSWSVGSIPELMSKPTGEASRDWFNKYGPTLQWRNTLYEPTIMTRDLGLTTYILTHDDEFTRTPEQLYNFTMLLGDNSIMTVDKDDHKRLRRIMFPAFSHGAMNAQWPLFLEKTNELRSKIPVDPKGAKVGAMSQMGQLTTDVMGISSFGLDLGALKGQPNELYKAWQDVLKGVQTRGRVAPYIASWLGRIGRFLPGQGINLFDQSRQTFERVGQNILETRRKELVEEPSDVKRSDFTGRDVISYLLRANMAQDIKDSAKMSDSELVSAMSTMIIASTLTTTSTLIWVLHYLATKPGVQDKLRAEVSQLSEEPSADEINNLAYLEAFVREVLRLYSAAASQIRQASKTITLPLNEPVLGRDGRVMHNITIDKGSVIYMPIPNLNTNTNVFGADAEVFRPERHLDSSIKGDGFPGAWGNVMTFSHGSRSCLGFRFAIMQIKAVCFTLLRSFELSEPAGQEVVRMGMVASSKTIVKGTNNSDVPIIFKPLSKEV